ncbi:MAG: RecQ family ATP-dependent DNA helicase [Planctomycetota bacterium]
MPETIYLAAQQRDLPAQRRDLDQVSAQLQAKLQERLLAAVRETWGFSALRPHQDQAVAATLAGRDALVVLPTGGGKSLCYQAPALVREGLTVVVSPLISLMKDQIDGLHQNGVPAEMLTSAQEPRERREVMDALERGELRLLFVAPERLVMPGFARRLDEAGWRTLAVDEAHCISHWGHDFRPEYRQLGDLRRARPELSAQAYTATATPRVQRDIVAQLALRDPALVVGHFDRPNLTYRVQVRTKLLEQVLEVIARHPDEAGIVYCLRRSDVDKLVEKLKAKGVRCEGYHAGLTPAVRRRVQEHFRLERLDLVVATVAFGMGIDRPDVRFVVHASLPKGIEQYSQETGRAGRDGLPSECVLLHGGADYHGWKNLIERGVTEAEEAGHPDPDALREGSFGRLSEMWGFASSATCRHRLLVEHFGQTLRSREGGPREGGDASCGACDVCLGELAPVEDALIVAQKVLSCVARCQQRYGAAHVIEVLRGVASERVRRAGHEGLSTFGLLRELPTGVLRALVEQLQAMGYLSVRPGRYPTLFLTQRAKAVLSGAETPALYQPRGAKTRTARAEETEGADPALYERLRALRRRLAQEREVPPYVICGNQTLAAIAARRPRTLEELREIKGIGARKAETTGAALLAEIAAFVAEEERVTRR